ncbi:NADH-quinone oxidoreductase subunit A [bacterium]|nr:NADH-quinone oxidoreductase subunit A [bacterium]
MEIGAYTTIAIAAGVGIFCLAAGVFISWLLRPQNPTALKLEPYECGEPTVGPARIRFRSFFYLFAIVFVIFDVEVVFLFPWAVAFRKLGLFAFVEMIVFIAVLLLALAYAWRKGALRWQ